MLSLAASRSKTPSAQPSDPNIRLGFGETAARRSFFRVRHFGECLLLAVRDGVCNANDLSAQILLRQSFECAA
jgi:hypothetical protein